MKESGQQVKPELGECSGEGTTRSVLKVKSSKGKDILVVKVRTNEQSQITSQGQDEKAKDKSVSRVDNSTAGREGEKCKTERFDLPVEFEDPMFKLMEGKELEEEYNEMTLEQDEKVVSQLTPR